MGLGWEAAQIGARSGGRAPSDQSFDNAVARLEEAYYDALIRIRVVKRLLFSTVCPPVVVAACRDGCPLFHGLRSIGPRRPNTRGQQQIWRPVRGLVTYPAVAAVESCRSARETRPLGVVRW